MRSSFTLPDIKQKIKRSTFLINQNTANSNKSTQTNNDIVVKAFQQKLDTHKVQIQKNSLNIIEIGQKFEMIKLQLLNERKNNQELQMLISKYKEQIQNQNRMLKVQKLKYEELEKNSNKETQNYKINFTYLEIKEKQFIHSIQIQEKKSKKLETEYLNLLNANKQITRQLQLGKINLKKQSDQVIRHKQQINRLLKQIESLKEEKSDLKRLIQEDEYDFNRLKFEKQQQQLTIKKLKEQFRQKQQNLNNKYKKQKSILENEKRNMETELIKLRKFSNEHQNFKKQMQKQKQQKILAYKNQTEDKFRKISDELNKLKEKFVIQTTKMREQIIQNRNKAMKYDQIKKNLQKIEMAQKDIQSNIKCKLCNQILKQPVTIIPCGHTFCLTCKKAYRKQCKICGPQIKVDASYRNQLLDELLEIYNCLHEVVKVLNKY